MYVFVAAVNQRKVTHRGHYFSWRSCPGLMLAVGEFRQNYY